MKEKTKEIIIKPMKEGELLIITVGDPNNKIIPTQDMLMRIEDMIKSAMEDLPARIIVPYFVKIKKIKINKPKEEK